MAQSDPALGALRPYAIHLSDGTRTQDIRGALLDATWQVKWFRWDQPQRLDPKDDAGWSRLFASPPILEQASHNPDWGAAWSVPAPTVPATCFAYVARSRVKLPKGTYKFAVHYAGGIRILIDGVSIVNNWGDSPWVQTGEKTVELAEGEHEFVIQNYREKGRVFLKLYWGRSD
jgi:hypothetical protein